MTQPNLIRIYLVISFNYPQKNLLVKNRKMILHDNFLGALPSLNADPNDIINILRDDADLANQNAIQATANALNRFYENRPAFIRSLYGLCMIAPGGFPFSVFDHYFSGGMFQIFNRRIRHVGIQVENVYVDNPLQNINNIDINGNTLEQNVESEIALERSFGFTSLFVNIPGGRNILINDEEEKRKQKRLRLLTFLTSAASVSPLIQSALTPNLFKRDNCRFEIRVRIPTHFTNNLLNGNNLNANDFRNRFAEVFVSLLEEVFHAKFLLDVIDDYLNQDRSLIGYLTDNHEGVFSPTIRKLFIYGPEVNENPEERTFFRCYLRIVSDQDHFAGFNALRILIRDKILARKNVHKQLIHHYLELANPGVQLGGQFHPAEKFRDLFNAIRNQERFSFYRPELL